MGTRRWPRDQANPNRRTHDHHPGSHALHPDPASEPPETYVEAGLARIRELKAERDQFALDRDEARAAIRDRVAQIDLQKAAPEALNEQERNDLAGLAFAAERQHAAVEAIDVRLRPFEDSC